MLQLNNEGTTRTWLCWLHLMMRLMKWQSLPLAEAAANKRLKLSPGNEI